MPGSISAATNLSPPLPGLQSPAAPGLFAASHLLPREDFDPRGTLLLFRSVKTIPYKKRIKQQNAFNAKTANHMNCRNHSNTKTHLRINIKTQKTLKHKNSMNTFCVKTLETNKGFSWLAPFLLLNAGPDLSQGVPIPADPTVDGKSMMRKNSRCFCVAEYKNAQTDKTKVPKNTKSIAERKTIKRKNIKTQKVIKQFYAHARRARGRVW